MHEFIINVSLVLLSASGTPPTVRTSGLNIAQTGDKIVIMSIKSETPHEDMLDITSVVIQNKSPLSVEEQREINYIGYLR